MKIGQKLYRKGVISPIEEFEIIKKEYEPVINGNLWLLNNQEYITKKNNNIVCLNNLKSNYYKTREEAMNCYYNKRIEFYKNDINKNNKRIVWLKIDIGHKQREYNEIGGYISKEKVDKLEIGQKIYDHKDNEYKIDSILIDRDGTKYNIETDNYKFNVIIKDDSIVFCEEDQEIDDYGKYIYDYYPNYEFKTTKEESRLYGLMIKIDELEKKIKRLEGFNKESELKINKFKNKIK